PHRSRTLVAALDAIFGHLKHARVDIVPAHDLDRDAVTLAWVDAHRENPAASRKADGTIRRHRKMEVVGRPDDAEVSGVLGGARGVMVLGGAVVGKDGVGRVLGPDTQILAL